MLVVKYGGWYADERHYNGPRLERKPTRLGPIEHLQTEIQNDTTTAVTS